MPQNTLTCMSIANTIDASKTISTMWDTTYWQGQTACQQQIFGGIFCMEQYYSICQTSQAVGIYVGQTGQVLLYQVNTSTALIAMSCTTHWYKIYFLPKSPYTNEF